MALLLKLCLLVVSLAGVGSAIGVPLMMKVGEKRDTSSVKTNEGGGVAQVFVDIKKCVESDSDGWSSIEFGDKQDGEICWTLGSHQEPALDNFKDKFTDLFKKKWNKGAGAWNDNSKQSNSWNSVCGEGPSWVITTESGNEDEYLGTCEWSTGAQKLFIKKKVEETDYGKKKKVTLSICQGECLTEQTISKWKQLSSPEKGIWLPVTFKSKNTFLN